MNSKSNNLIGPLRIEHLRRTLERFRQNLDALPAAARLAERVKIQAVERELRDCGAAGASC